MSDTNEELKPIKGRVWIRRDPPERETAGGLIIVPRAQEKPTTGRVVSVHRGKHTAKGVVIPCGVQPGDRVVFGPYAGTDVQGASIGFPELGLLVVMPEDEILAVLED